MVVFFAAGRLGNQLFQYCALRSLPHAGQIMAFGMEDLCQHFDGHSLASDRTLCRLMRKIFKRLGPRRLENLARSNRLITLAEEIERDSKITFKITPGTLKKLAFVPTSFFQAENVVTSTSIGALSLKNNILARAASVLDRLPRSRRELFFVHVRRGDYATFPSIDYPAMLPLNWYQEQIDFVQKRHPSAFFVIVSDDRPCIEKFFARQGNVWVSDQEEGIIDFGIMTLCGGGGIMSASSFSWWGGYFCRRNNPAGIFLAPHLWFGVRQGTWNPPQIKTSWIEYRPVTF